MKVYMITYDLNSSGQDYEMLHETIQSFGSWAHYFTSVWFVYTSMNPIDMRDKIQSVIDKNDTFFICSVNDYQGYASEELWEWLSERV